MPKNVEPDKDASNNKTPNNDKASNNNKASNNDKASNDKITPVDLNSLTKEDLIRKLERIRIICQDAAHDIDYQTTSNRIVVIGNILGVDYPNYFYKASYSDAIHTVKKPKRKKGDNNNSPDDDDLQVS